MRRSRLASGPEFELVRRLLEAAGDDDGPGWLGPGDDAAVIEPPAGEQLVVSCDISVEDVHFRREWLRWDTVGYRAVVAGLSDLAAMAARPLGVLVSAALPPELGEGVLEAMGRGMGRCLEAEGGALLGGDLSRSPGPVALDVVAVGSTASPVPRSGVRPGDEVWVTGRPGGPASATRAWQRGLEPDPRARRAFEEPRPRIREAQWLAERAALTALIDVSDGVAADSRHLAAASGCGLDLRLDRIPLPDVLDEYTDRRAALELAVTGGEDYELLMTAEPGSLQAVRDGFRREFDLDLERIGEAVAEEGVRWRDSDGAEVALRREGYDHFARDDE